MMARGSRCRLDAEALPFVFTWMPKRQEWEAGRRLAMGLGGLSGSYSKLRLESNSLSSQYAMIPKTVNKLVRVAVRRQF